MSYSPDKPTILDAASLRAGDIVRLDGRTAIILAVALTAPDVHVYYESAEGAFYGVMPPDMKVEHLGCYGDEPDYYGDGEPFPEDLDAPPPTDNTEHH